MLNSFIKHGINPCDIHILVAYSPDENDKTNHPDVVDLYSRLINRYGSVNFFFYKDTRVNPSYIPSIRPNILKKHFQYFKGLENDIIFYHDCDIVFTKNPDFSKFINNKICYVSDTSSYLNADYILSKGSDIYEKMCQIVGIHPSIPKLMNSNSGGAQYLLKGINSEFWEKVETDCEKLYKFFLQDEQIKLNKNPSYHPIQRWTSDMWAVLWNLWILEKETKVDPYFDFTWATDPIEKWNKNFIFHNAGVTAPGELFYKGIFMNALPYNIENKFNTNFASYNYFKEIQEVKNIPSCLLNF